MLANHELDDELESISSGKYKEASSRSYIKQDSAESISSSKYKLDIK